MKKARAWLDKRGVEYVFHDYKTRRHRARRSSKAGRNRPAGKRCSTAPAPPSASSPKRSGKGSRRKKAIALMLAQPSMIKRPVLEANGKLLVGFKPEMYEQAFGKRG
jgi:arsenate reductase (glutaredoxin)